MWTYQSLVDICYLCKNSPPITHLIFAVLYLWLMNRPHNSGENCIVFDHWFFLFVDYGEMSIATPIGRLRLAMMSPVDGGTWFLSRVSATISFYLVSRFDAVTPVRHAYPIATWLFRPLEGVGDRKDVTSRWSDRCSNRSSSCLKWRSNNFARYGAW